MMWIHRVRFVWLIYHCWKANKQEMWEIICPSPGTRHEPHPPAAYLNGAPSGSWSIQRGRRLGGWCPSTVTRHQPHPPAAYLNRAPSGSWSIPRGRRPPTSSSAMKDPLNHTSHQAPSEEHGSEKNRGPHTRRKQSYKLRGHLQPPQWPPTPHYKAYLYKTTRMCGATLLADDAKPSTHKDPHDRVPSTASPWRTPW